uniref:Uncharacterized protein n=1 Tax=Geladintestivirus 4 TaxID=3233136 RepID=A0AAU8MJN0_9CAUD
MSKIQILRIFLHCEMFKIYYPNKLFGKTI